jgi:hypothetical protein
MTHCEKRLLHQKEVTKSTTNVNNQHLSVYLEDEICQTLSFTATTTTNVTERDHSIQRSGLYHFMRTRVTTKASKFCPLKPIFLQDLVGLIWMTPTSMILTMRTLINKQDFHTMVFLSSSFNNWISNLTTGTGCLKIISKNYIKHICIDFLHVFSTSFLSK